MFVKILNFPYVIQREIIKQMDYPKLFLFSLCSLKSFKLIQSIKFREVIEFKFLYYCDVCYLFDVVHKDGNSSRILALIPNLDIDNRRKREIKELILFGRKAKLSFSEKGFTLCFYEETVNEAILEVIHDYFRLLFGLKLKTSLESFSSKDDELLIPKLKNTTSSILRSIRPIKPKLLEDFLSVSPNQEHVEMYTPPIEGAIKRNSRFYNINRLNVRNAQYSGSDLLQYFNGQSLFLEKAKLSDFPLIWFLEKWIANKSFQNLEILKIEVEDGYLLNPVRIMRNFLVKKFDSSRDPPKFEFEKKTMDKLISDHFSSPTYLVRDCDGIVASVLVTKTAFLFGVWNLNEKQLAEKFYK